MRTSARPVPVRISFPQPSARQDGWGRLLALSAAGATVSTLTQLSRGERVLLSFETAGERFEALRAEVTWVESDADGYCAAELDFKDEVERRRLAKVLLDVLAR